MLELISATKDIPKVQTVKVGFGRGVAGQLPAKLHLFMQNRDLQLQGAIPNFWPGNPKWNDSCAPANLKSFQLKKHFCGTEWTLPSHGLI